MSTCKNCKYWKHLTNQYNDRWDECTAADWFDRNGPITGKQFGVYADASDDTGLSAGFMTGPDFGCVNFKGKE